MEAGWGKRVPDQSACNFSYDPNSNSFYQHFTRQSHPPQYLVGFRFVLTFESSQWGRERDIGLIIKIYNSSIKKWLGRGGVKAQNVAICEGSIKEPTRGAGHSCRPPERARQSEACAAAFHTDTDSSRIKCKSHAGHGLSDDLNKNLADPTLTRNLPPVHVCWPWRPW